MKKRLYRSNVENKIAGVCGGLGEYFDIDPTIVRIILFLLIFAHGAGLIIYIVGWIVMPRRPLESGVETVNRTDNSQNPETKSENHGSSNAGYLWPGLILIVLGLVFLAHNMWWWFDWSDFWPVILIVAGALILIRAYNNDRVEDENNQAGPEGIANESR